MRGGVFFCLKIISCDITSGFIIHVRKSSYRQPGCFRTDFERLLFFSFGVYSLTWSLFDLSDNSQSQRKKIASEGKGVRNYLREFYKSKILSSFKHQMVRCPIYPGTHSTTDLNFTFKRVHLFLLKKLIPY